jgi:hypothetical protein
LAVVKLFTGSWSVARLKTLWELSGSAAEILDPDATPPYESPTPMRTIPPELMELGALGKMGEDGLLYLALPKGDRLDISPRVVTKQHVLATLGSTERKIVVVANGVELDPDTVRPEAAGFWAGEQISFSIGEIPPLPVTTTTLYQPNGLPPLVVFWPKRDVTWGFRSKWVNRTNILAHDCVEYLADASLLQNVETSAWWVDDGIKRVGTAIEYRFANGQRVFIVASGLIGMNRPQLKEICTNGDLAYPNAILTPNFNIGEYAQGIVSLGLIGAGGYAKFWAKFQSRPGDYYFYTQIFQSSVSTNNVLAFSTVGGWWTDGPVERLKPGSLSPAGLDGVGVVQQSDAPWQRMTPTSTTRSDSFRAYIRYRPPGANSIPITLGRFDWGWGFSASWNGGWSVTPTDVQEPAWHVDDSFPHWVNALPEGGY